ncbi:hypothetical protein ACTTZI_004179 [Vibrio vulnificus]
MNINKQRGAMSFDTLIAFSISIALGILLLVGLLDYSSKKIGAASIEHKVEQINDAVELYLEKFLLSVPDGEQFCIKSLPSIDLNDLYSNGYINFEPNGFSLETPSSELAANGRKATYNELILISYTFLDESSRNRFLPYMNPDYIHGTKVTYQSYSNSLRYTDYGKMDESFCYVTE